eukprot:tig00021571_g22354.t1
MPARARPADDPQWRWSPVPTPPARGAAIPSPERHRHRGQQHRDQHSDSEYEDAQQGDDDQAPGGRRSGGGQDRGDREEGANEAAGKLRVTETKAKAQLATADWPAEGKERTLEATATTRATGDTGTGAPGTATMPTTSTSTLMTPTTRTREMTTETMTLTVELERGGYTATMNTAAWASMARAKITTQGTPRVTPTWGMHENATAEISKRRMLTVALEVVHVNAPASTAAATGTADGMDTAARPAAPAIGTTSALRATVVNATGTTGLAGQADGTAETGPAVLDAVSTGTGGRRRQRWASPAGGDGNVYGGGGGGGRPAAAANGTGPNTAKVYLVLFGDGLASRLVPPDAPQDTRDEILASARIQHRRRRCDLRCGHVVCGDRIEESSPCIAIKYANITEARRAAQLLTPVTPQLATLAVLGATGPLSVGIHVDAPASSTEFFAIEAELGCRKMERGTLSSFMKNTVLRALTSGINPDAYEANDVVVAYNELAVKPRRTSWQTLATSWPQTTTQPSSPPRFQDPDPDFCWNNDRKHVLNGVLIFAGAHAGCGHADANQEHVPFPGNECQLDITQLVPDRQFIMDLRAAGVLYMTTRPSRWVIILEVTHDVHVVIPLPQSEALMCAAHFLTSVNNINQPLLNYRGELGGGHNCQPLDRRNRDEPAAAGGQAPGGRAEGAVDCMWTLPTAERVAGARRGCGRPWRTWRAGGDWGGAGGAGGRGGAGGAHGARGGAGIWMPAAGRAQPMAAVAVGWTSSGATSPGAALLGEPGAGWAPPAVGADSQAVAPAAGVDEEHVQRLPWQY